MPIDQPRPHQVKLPGFIIDTIDEPLGLGDVIKRATRSLGINPCGGCEGRAAALNRWMVLSGRQSHTTKLTSSNQ